MIVIVATRIDDRGHFKYAAEGGQLSLVTEDANALVASLQTVGVSNPYRLISHAEQWGMVEIVVKKESDTSERITRSLEEVSG